MMTREQILSATDDKLDRLAAEKVMGWVNSGGTFSMWVHPDDALWLKAVNDCDWHPSASMADAFTVQAEIERRGLQERFRLHPKSLRIVDATDSYSNNQWHYINASARQRTVAALLAVIDYASPRSG